jgi:hypothetical protein
LKSFELCEILRRDVSERPVDNVRTARNDVWTFEGRWHIRERMAESRNRSNESIEVVLRRYTSSSTRISRSGFRKKSGRRRLRDRGKNAFRR